MATKPKAILSTHDGREASPITRASNVLFENGQTAQDILNDRQDAMISPVIENSSSMFKVGQGDNVDYSSNVVNGAYESMVLKGKSMVNCIQEPSSQDVVLPYEFAEGQYVTINDTKESGALGVELKGQTLVNLASTATLKSKDGGSGTFVNGKLRVNFANYTWSGVCFLNNGIMKPSTEYTLIAKATNTTSFSIEIGHNNSFYNAFTPINLSRLVLGAGESSSIKVALTTRDDLQSNAVFYNIMASENPASYSGNKFIDIELIILEGNYTNVDIPFFTGMASCKMPILHTVGKNLFDKNKSENILNGYYIDEANKSLKPSSDTLTVFIENLNGVSNLVMSGNGTRNIWLFMDSNGNAITTSNAKSVSVPNRTHSAYVYVSNGIPTNGYTVENLQIEEGSVATSYEPYKSSILSLPEEVVLRGIPNGVCDVFNAANGILAKKTQEVVLNGVNERWTVEQGNVDHITGNAWFKASLGEPISYLSQGIVPSVADKLATHNINIYAENRTAVGICIENHIAEGELRLQMNLPQALIGGTSIEDLKNYLKQNPVTIVVPSNVNTTKINLPSTLKSWNTTTHIYSEIPENSLYPILSHSNPTYSVILKPSTKYSIVANSYSNNHTNSAINFNLGGATASTTVGNRVTTITTPSTLSNELLTMSGRGNKLNNVMVIEGDVMGDEPYFEGICDCKSPILLNCGENLFDKTKVKREKYQNYNVPNGIFSISSNSNYKVTDYIRVKPNTSYTSRNLGDGAYYTFNKKPITDIFCRAGNFTVPSNAHYVVLNMSIGQDEDAVGLQEVPSSSLHEPYKSNTTTFDQKDGKTIVLRSLPNGVCDTLNVETGEYVQRIGEAILNGSQGVNSWWNTTSTIGVGIPIPTMKNISKLNCDKLPVVSYGAINNDTYDKDGIASWDTGNIVRFRIEKSKLTTEDVDGVKQYLQQNPITIQYELAEPIVKTVDLSGYPFSYENGHVILSSGSIEQSLTPKVDYSVATNRNGQIRSNQKMVERHQKQLDQLQAIILANLVNSQYNQTLTTLKYELSRV